MKVYDLLEKTSSREPVPGGGSISALAAAAAASLVEMVANLTIKVAAEVPLAVAENILALLPLAKFVIKKGNPTALTDGLVGVMMARSGALGALRNVRINLDSIKDQVYVSRLSVRVRELESLIVRMEKDILDDFLQSHKS